MSIKKDAVVAIIQKGDTFLFIKRSDYIETAAGYWCPVSGRLEENETQIEALEREVMEEVGLGVNALKKFAKYLPITINSHCISGRLK
jgi:8-oxo-dGTP pyrophosphatase MutT (NUDIX family)